MTDAIKLILRRENILKIIKIKLISAVGKAPMLSPKGADSALFLATSISPHSRAKKDFILTKNKVESQLKSIGMLKFTPFIPAVKIKKK